MKKGIKAILAIVLLALCVFVGNRLYDRYYRNNDELNIARIKMASINEKIRLGDRTYTVTSYGVSTNLKNFPGLIGKKIEGLSYNDSGRITNDMKIVVVHFRLKNEDMKNSDINVNGFQLVDKKDPINKYYELKIYNLRSDINNTEYFHQKIPAGGSIDVIGGFMVPKNVIQNESMQLFFTSGGYGSEDTRFVPLDLK